MKKRILKKILGCVCSYAMIFSLSMTAFAADNALQLRDISQNVPAVEGDIELPNQVGDVEVVREEAPKNQDMITNELTFEDAEKPNSGARETWRLVQEIYNGTGSLSTDDSECVMNWISGSIDDLL